MLFFRFRFRAKIPIFFLLLMAMAWFRCAPLFAQASVNVPTTDPVYRDIDKLVAHGLVDRIIMGQRPFSRREIARIGKEAMAHLPRLTDKLEDPGLSPEQKSKIQQRLDYVQVILSRMRRDYHEELVQLGAAEGKSLWYSLHPIESAEASFVAADSPSEQLLTNNGLGSINAQINPLLDYHQGRHLVNGSTLALETTHWFRLSDYFAMLIRPRFQIGIGRDGTPDQNRVDVLNLNGTFLIKNVQMEFGRDNLYWGQGEDFGLMLSNNPRGLDMAKLSSDSPFYLPGPLRHIGPLKFTFFYSDLGPEQLFPNSYLAGYKLSFEPWRFFEIGLSILDNSGGTGSPPASFGQRVADLFPITDATTGDQVPIGNKFFGVDFRFRIPPARNLEIYSEIIFDDINRHSFSNIFIQDTGYLLGFYLPRLNNTGTLDLRLEAHRTPERFYRHAQMINGMALNQFLLGDNLGPNAFGGRFVLGYEVNSENLLNFGGAFESRSSDLYEPFLVNNGNTLKFRKIQDNPEERRYRISTEWLHRMGDLPLRLDLRLAYERVQNFQFIGGNDRNNVVAEGTLRIDLDRWTRFPR